MVLLRNFVLFHLLITGAASISQTLSGTDDFCYDNYINTDGYCFKVFDSQRTKAFFARRTCERNQGHLVYIDSQDKNEALLKYLGKYTTTDTVYIDGRMTGDIELINYEGDGMVYTNWGRHRPHCVVFNVRTGTWDLSSCQDNLDFVCEMYW